MKIKIPHIAEFKNEYEISLVILFLLSFFLSGTEMLIITIMYLFFNTIINRKISVKRNLYVSAYIIIGLVGSLSGILSYQLVDSYGVIRYWFYILTPVVSLIYGYTIMKKNDIRSIMKSLCLCGVLSCTRYYIACISNISVHTISLDFFRSCKGFLSPMAVIAFLILLFYGKKHSLFKENVLKIYKIILLFAIASSFSRTLLLMLTIVFLINVTINIGNKNTRKILFSSFAIIFLVVVVVSTNPVTSSLVNSYIDKIFSSTDELKQTSNWSTAEINTKWRSYEMYCAITQFKEASILNKIFGAGYKGVNVGNYAQLVVANSKDTYIPLLHNGYYGVLCYGGIFGVLIYISFFVAHFFMALKSNVQHNQFGGLYMGLIISLSVMAYIVMGPINQEGIYFEYVVIGVLASNCNYKENEICNIRK